MQRLLVLLCFLFLVSEAWAATYYMSPTGTGSACSAAVPCGNYSTAWHKLAPGDTLYFKGGTYGDLSITNQSGPIGTAANPITMASAPGEMATIGGMGFNIYGDASGCAGTCEIAYIIVDRVTITTNGFSVSSYDPFDVPTPGVHHITLQNSEVRNSAPQGISFFGHTGHHNTIRNCQVHHNGGADPARDHGFYGNDHKDILIEGSTFYSNNSYGIQVWVFSGAGPIAKRHIIRNNIIYGNGQGGITLSHIDDAQVYNNIVYENGFGPASGGGGISLSYGSPTNMRLWNNTITGNNGDCILLGSIADGSTVVSPHIINNICYNNTNGIASSPNSSVSSPTYTTNLCGTSGTGCFVIGTPGFEDSAAHNYHLTALSNARNVGTTLTTFDTDYDRVHRPQGTAWDIGAYEYPEATDPISGNPIYVAKTGSDSNSCTVAENASTPKLTLTSACTCMTVPGKTMFIKAGTYVEKWDTLTCPITGGNGPSFSDATLITGFASDVVTIQLPGGTVDIPAFFLRNGVNDKYTIYRNLIIDANNQVGSNGIAIYPNVHHIRFENVEVKNTLNGYETLYLYGPNNIGVYDSYIHHAQLDGVAIDGTTSNITFQRTRIKTHSGKGIHLMPGQTITNLTVRECDVSSNTLDAIDLESGNTVLLANNRIYSNGAKGIFVRSPVTAIQMYFLSITGNATHGLDCQSGVTSAEIKNVISYNNASGNIQNSCGAVTETNFTTNPLFTNAATGDLTLQDASGAIDQGTPIAGISNDFAGLARPQGATDIGSDERTGGASADVTVRSRLLAQTGMLF